eukprot:gene22645-23864_t
MILFGMLVMSHLEGWSAPTGFYWATVTVMTVGYGDLVPSSWTSKWFTIFYALIGCGLVTLTLTEF